MRPTCCFFKLGKHWLVDVVVDALRVAVVSNEEHVIDCGVLLSLPQGQTEPGYKESMNMYYKKHWIK